MTVYVDTSALLRVVLRGTGSLDDLRRQDALISRELVVVESVRTVDRLRLLGRLTTEEAADRLRSLHDWLEALDLVLLRPAVLRRAGEPMPTPIGTLDPIHLASALLWRERQGPITAIATHDAALARAARSFGFDAQGV